MEVHTHAHTLPDSHRDKRKKWTHYLWEFFMLFLAVTAGFFVENRREHFIEAGRERQYVRSLIEDLKADTAYLNNARIIHDQSCKMIDTLITLLKNKDRNVPVKKIYWLARVIPFRDQTILVHDKTFEQLKNSGSLRLIHKQFLLDSISDYYQTYKWISTGPSIMEIRNRQELFLTLEKLFDMSVFQQMVHSPDPFTPEYPETDPVLLSRDEQVINSICARYHFMYSIKRVLQSSAEDLFDSAKRLMQLLQKEYHFE